MKWKSKHDIQLKKFKPSQPVGKKQKRGTGQKNKDVFGSCSVQASQ